MRIKLVVYNMFYEDEIFNPNRYSESTHDFDGNTTIFDLLDNDGVSLVDLSHYYKVSGDFYFEQGIFPYIIDCNGKIRWNSTYSETKVIEFLKTHKIENNYIEAKIWFPLAGGPGAMDLIDIWKLVYPVLEEFVTCYGLISIAGKGYCWIKSLFKTDIVPPHTYFDLIYSRSLWNHFELAETLDIDSAKAKEMLKVLGYEYDRKKLMFVQQPSSHVLREKISKINILDI